jgi:hypothetical protein
MDALEPRTGGWVGMGRGGHQGSYQPDRVQSKVSFVAADRSGGALVTKLLRYFILKF